MYSIENLISFVEFNQFKLFYLSDNENDSSMKIKFEVCPNVPKSEIVYDPELSIEEKIVKLCEKYVLSNAPHALNISWNTSDND